MRKILISGAVVAGIGAVALGVGFGLPLYESWQGGVAADSAPADAAAAPAVDDGASDDGAAESATADAPDAQQERQEARLTAPPKPGAAADESGASPESEDSVKPSFDVVRVSRDGVAVIAGRAQPNTNVTILDGEAELGSVQANDRGEWVMVLEEPLGPGHRELSAVARLGEETERRSEAPVVILVPERPSGVIADAGAPVSGPIVVQLPAAGGSSRLLQVPEPGDAGGKVGELSVQALDYDQDGNVVVSGSAPPGKSVRVYLDNKPVGDAVADADGTWRMSPTQPVPPGDYKLRVDRLAKDGKVTARIELPFQRADPARLLQLTDGGTRVVVQPGNSLWRIARRVYGYGIQYTVIYDANRGDIRDPDLIYPGQIFDLPQEN